MNDKRLIEVWFPISEIGIESLRERTPMVPYPAPNRLHIWWARRPLVASRAAVLASALSSDAHTEKRQFLDAIGIHGDPVTVKRRLELAKRTGERLGANPYGYGRAFTYCPTSDDARWIQSMLAVKQEDRLSVLDPTGGGGAIPLEALRLGFQTFGNDINPVATLVQKATYEFPHKYGSDVLKEYRLIASIFLERMKERLAKFYPASSDGSKVLAFMFARTCNCPYCDGLVPLSPNWKLDGAGNGVRLVPETNQSKRKCSFEFVTNKSLQSPGTISGGDITCPFPDCGRVIDGDILKTQGQEGKLGEQLYAVVARRRVSTEGAGGKKREKWELFYRAPVAEDDVSDYVASELANVLPEWEAMNYVPNERFPQDANDTRPIQYGMPYWRDLFSPRQLLCHGTAVATFRELLDERTLDDSREIVRAAFVYLSFAIDKLLDWNSRQCTWETSKLRMAHTFHIHGFPFISSFAEMPAVSAGDGYQWVLGQTGDCLEEILAMMTPKLDLLSGGCNSESTVTTKPQVTVTCKSGDSLDHLGDQTIDVIVLDPPYYNNVMYAELSDFFYVWLKRTAGIVFPELFKRALTDKENEAVANPAKFQNEKGASALAGRDYQDRMGTIFAECHRVLKPNGVMTLMFTHKATGAWDALTIGLINAGFVITASWPINTEAEASLHIKNKAAANSTIFLVCRPKGQSEDDIGEKRYWEDVEPLVANAVRKRIVEFREGGISGVDLYLASFGPALEEFSRHWPLQRGTPRPKPQETKRRRQSELFEAEYDPYAVTPEDALDAARREVKRWRLEQLTHMKASAELDAATSWFVLAWDAFRATVFDYDEALRLARAVGVDLDKDIVGWLAEKKGSDVRLLDSATRAAKGSLGPADGSRAIIDAIHHAAHIGRTRNLAAAKELLTKNAVDQDPRFFASLEAVLEVLPVSKAFSGIELEGDVAGQGSDFEILENLRRLAYSDKVDEPKQLDLWKDEAAAP